MSEITKKPHERELFGHPAGLYILFFTEMWERFSFYGMRALFTIYLTTKTIGDNPGLGWSPLQSIMLYGWYTMLVYLAAIPGGMIADKLIGQKKSVLYGGILLVIGHSVLAIQNMTAFYTGLIFIILGVGMLKPNISTMVGGLYKEGDIRRDKGFSIFYVGINLGSLLATIIVGYVGEEIGWHYGFGLAGIGMALGLLQYAIGQKYLKKVGDKPIKNKKKNDAPLLKLLSDLFKSPLQLMIVVAIVGYGVYAGFNFEGKDSWGYTLLFCFIGLIAGMMMMIYKELETQVVKDRYLVLLISLGIVIVFWGAFEQAGGLMNIYADKKTDRFASLKGINLLFYISIGVVFLKGLYQRLRKKTDYIYWLIGTVGLVVMFLSVKKYLLTSDPFEIPATWFQSLNAGFIIILATAVAAFWARRKMKNKEASSLFKMAIGTVIMGLGFVFMVFATLEFQAKGSSGMQWLVLAYLFHTVGELCCSPVALSFFTKLSPPKYASLMMGVYFAATGLGNKVAGILGETASTYSAYAVFLGITIFTIVFALLIILLIKPLKRLTHGVEENELGLSEVQLAEPFELAEEDH